jgi:hypothetical protein
MLMIGREVNQPAGLLYRSPDAKTDDSLDDYVKRLRKGIWTAHETARDTLETTQNTKKRDYDVRILERQYKVGDIVYVLDTAKTKGRAKKLDPPWKGPGIICAS